MIASHSFTEINSPNVSRAQKLQQQNQRKPGAKKKNSLSLCGGCLIPQKAQKQGSRNKKNFTQLLTSPSQPGLSGNPTVASANSFNPLTQQTKSFQTGVQVQNYLGSNIGKISPTRITDNTYPSRPGTVNKATRNTVLDKQRFLLTSAHSVQRISGMNRIPTQTEFSRSKTKLDRPNSIASLNNKIPQERAASAACTRRLSASYVQKKHRNLQSAFTYAGKKKMMMLSTNKQGIDQYISDAGLSLNSSAKNAHFFEKRKKKVSIAEDANKIHINFQEFGDKQSYIKSLINDTQNYQNNADYDKYIDNENQQLKRDDSGMGRLPEPNTREYLKTLSKEQLNDYYISNLKSTAEKRFNAKSRSKSPPQMSSQSPKQSRFQLKKTNQNKFDMNDLITSHISNLKSITKKRQRQVLEKRISSPGGRCNRCTACSQKKTCENKKDESYVQQPIVKSRDKLNDDMRFSAALSECQVIDESSVGRLNIQEASSPNVLPEQIDDQTETMELIGPYKEEIIITKESPKVEIQDTFQWTGPVQMEENQEQNPISIQDIGLSQTQNSDPTGQPGDYQQQQFLHVKTRSGQESFKQSSDLMQYADAAVQIEPFYSTGSPSQLPKKIRELDVANITRIRIKTGKGSKTKLAGGTNKKDLVKSLDLLQAYGEFGQFMKVTNQIVKQKGIKINIRTKKERKLPKVVKVEKKPPVPKFRHPSPVKQHFKLHDLERQFQMTQQVYRRGLDVHTLDQDRMQMIDAQYPEEPLEDMYDDEVDQLQGHGRIDVLEEDEEEYISVDSASSEDDEQIEKAKDLRKLKNRSIKEVQEAEEQELQVEVKNVVINSDDQLEFQEQRELRQASRYTGSDGMNMAKSLQHVSIPNLELQDLYQEDIDQLKHEEIKLPLNPVIPAQRPQQPPSVQLSTSLQNKNLMKIGVHQVLDELYGSLSSIITVEYEMKVRPQLQKPVQDEEAVIKQMFAQESSVEISKQESAAMGDPKSSPPMVSEGTPEFQIRQQSSVRVGHVVFVQKSEQAPSIDVNEPEEPTQTQPVTKSEKMSEQEHQTQGQTTTMDAQEYIEEKLELTQTKMIERERAEKMRLEQIKYAAAEKARLEQEESAKIMRKIRLQKEEAAEKQRQDQLLKEEEEARRNAELRRVAKLEEQERLKNAAVEEAKRQEEEKLVAEEEEAVAQEQVVAQWYVDRLFLKRQVNIQMSQIYDESCTRVILMDQVNRKQVVQFFLEETYNGLSGINLDPEIFEKTRQPLFNNQCEQNDLEISSYDYLNDHKISSTPNEDRLVGKNPIQLGFQQSGSQSPVDSRTSKMQQSKKKHLLRFHSEAFEPELDVSEINLANQINYSSGILESQSKTSEQTKINNSFSNLVIGKNAKQNSPKIKPSESNLTSYLLNERNVQIVVDKSDKNNSITSQNHTNKSSVILQNQSIPSQSQKSNKAKSKTAENLNDYLSENSGGTYLVNKNQAHQLTVNTHQDDAEESSQRISKTSTTHVMYHSTDQQPLTTQHKKNTESTFKLGSGMGGGSNLVNENASDSMLNQTAINDSQVCMDSVIIHSNGMNEIKEDDHDTRRVLDDKENNGAIVCGSEQIAVGNSEIMDSNSRDSNLGSEFVYNTNTNEEGSENIDNGKKPNNVQIQPSDLVSFDAQTFTDPRQTMEENQQYHDQGTSTPINQVFDIDNISPTPDNDLDYTNSTGLKTDSFPKNNFNRINEKAQIVENVISQEKPIRRSSTFLERQTVKQINSGQIPSPKKHDQGQRKQMDDNQTSNFLYPVADNKRRNSAYTQQINHSQKNTNKASEGENNSFLLEDELEDEDIYGQESQNTQQNIQKITEYKKKQHEQYLSLKKNNVGAMAIDERTARREYSDYSKMDNISNNDAVNSNHYNRVQSLYQSQLSLDHSHTGLDIQIEQNSQSALHANQIQSEGTVSSNKDQSRQNNNGIRFPIKSPNNFKIKNQSGLILTEESSSNKGSQRDIGSVKVDIQPLNDLDNELLNDQYMHPVISPGELNNGIMSPEFGPLHKNSRLSIADQTHIAQVLEEQVFALNHDDDERSNLRGIIQGANNLQQNPSNFKKVNNVSLNETESEMGKSKKWKSPAQTIQSAGSGGEQWYYDEEDEDPEDDMQEEEKEVQPLSTSGEAKTPQGQFYDGSFQINEKEIMAGSETSLAQSNTQPTPMDLILQRNQTEIVRQPPAIELENSQQPIVSSESHGISGPLENGNFQSQQEYAQEDDQQEEEYGEEEYYDEEAEEEQESNALQSPKSEELQIPTQQQAQSKLLVHRQKTGLTESSQSLTNNDAISPASQAAYSSVAHSQISYKNRITKDIQGKKFAQPKMHLEPMELSKLNLNKNFSLLIADNSPGGVSIASMPVGNKSAKQKKEWGGSNARGDQSNLSLQNSMDPLVKQLPNTVYRQNSITETEYTLKPNTIANITQYSQKSLSSVVQKSNTKYKEQSSPLKTGTRSSKDVMEEDRKENIFNSHQQFTIEEDEEDSQQQEEYEYYDEEDEEAQIIEEGQRSKNMGRERSYSQDQIITKNNKQDSDRTKTGKVEQQTTQISALKQNVSKVVEEEEFEYYDEEDDN